MSEPYVGEIRMVGFSFAPTGWNLCDGSLLSIEENVVLFQLIGTYYGGDGQTTFAVPDLRGRRVVHQGNGYPLAQQAGEETVTLSLAQIPAHNHTPLVSPHPGTTSSPSGGVWAATSGSVRPYTPAAPAVAMSANALLADAGQSQPHENMPPFVTINFIISLFGVFPSSN